MPKGRTTHKMLIIGERPLPLEVRRHPRARHISLRLDGKEDRLRLVLPRGVSIAEGCEFARSKSAWVLRHLESRAPQIPFADGTVLPLLGEDHVIRHFPAARRGVWRDAGMIAVSGQAEHLPRRVRDFLKAEARETLTRRAREKAERLDRSPGRITLRDTTSRWGSCTANGDLSFSWRLVLAPEMVLDYVVAHEVAHLKELNHSARFWELTARLTDEIEGPKRWLRRHGESLLRYG